MGVQVKTEPCQLRLKSQKHVISVRICLRGHDSYQKLFYNGHVSHKHLPRAVYCQKAILGKRERTNKAAIIQYTSICKRVERSYEKEEKSVRKGSLEGRSIASEQEWKEDLGKATEFSSDEGHSVCTNAIGLELG